MYFIRETRRWTRKAFIFWFYTAIAPRSHGNLTAANVMDVRGTLQNASPWKLPDSLALQKKKKTTRCFIWTSAFGRKTYLSYITKLGLYSLKIVAEYKLTFAFTSLNFRQRLLCKSFPRVFLAIIFKTAEEGMVLWVILDVGETLCLSQPPSLHCPASEITHSSIFGSVEGLCYIPLL